MPKNKYPVVELVQKVNEKIKRLAQKKGISEEEVILNGWKSIFEQDCNSPSPTNVNPPKENETTPPEENSSLTTPKPQNKTHS